MQEMRIRMILTEKCDITILWSMIIRYRNIAHLLYQLEWEYQNVMVFVDNDAH